MCRPAFVLCTPGKKAVYHVRFRSTAPSASSAARWAAVMPVRPVRYAPDKQFGVTGTLLSLVIDVSRMRYGNSADEHTTI
jgi:hypothetical protein